MKTPLSYWKYFVAAATVNAVVFVGYRLNAHYKKVNKLNEKDESVVINTKGKKDKINEKGKK